MKEKIVKIREKIWNLIYKYKFNIFFIVITILSFYARYKMLDYKASCNK